MTVKWKRLSKRSWAELEILILDPERGPPNTDTMCTPNSEDCPEEGSHPDEMIANGGLVETQHSAPSTPCSAIGTIQIRDFLGTVCPIVNIPVRLVHQLHRAPCPTHELASPKRKRSPNAPYRTPSVPPRPSAATHPARTFSAAGRSRASRVPAIDTPTAHGEPPLSRRDARAAEGEVRRWVLSATRGVRGCV